MLQSDKVAKWQNGLLLKNARIDVENRPKSIADFWKPHSLCRIFAVSKQMRKFARQLKKFFSLVRQQISDEGRRTKDEPS